MQDSRVQIGNHNSESEVLIQSETALNAGETENHSMDQLEAIHQREQRCTVLLDTRTSSRRRLQCRDGEYLRKCWKEANHCFSAAMLI